MKCNRNNEKLTGLEIYCLFNGNEQLKKIFFIRLNVSSSHHCTFPNKLGSQFLSNLASSISPWGLFGYNKNCLWITSLIVSPLVYITVAYDILVYARQVSGIWKTQRVRYWHICIVHIIWLGRNIKDVAPCEHKHLKQRPKSYPLVSFVFWIILHHLKSTQA